MSKCIFSNHLYSTNIHQVSAVCKAYCVLSPSHMGANVKEVEEGCLLHTASQAPGWVRAQRTKASAVTRMQRVRRRGLKAV